MSDRIDDIIYDPPLISTRSLAAVESAKNQPTSLSLNMRGLEGYVMARKSKINGLLADTSQGKTSFMTALARNFTKQIDADAGEIGVFITWEDNIEDFGLADIANFSKIPLASLYAGDVKERQFNRLISAGAERAKSPLWLVGHSEESGARARMTMTDVWAVMENLKAKQGRKVRFVMMDYLQRINRQDQRGEGETRMQFSGVMDSIKDMTLAYQPATFIGSQVTRSKVEAQKWRQPQIHWAMETANFEHTCDGAISLWMPVKTKEHYKLGDCLQEKQNVNDKAIYVTKELIFAEILKQKKADTGHLQALDFVHEYNEFIEYGTAEKYRANIKKDNGDA